MAPGDPTDPLPCDGMLEEARAMLGKLAGAGEVVTEAYAMVGRHVEALAICRSRCHIRNMSTGEAPT